jgi:hypothetical protein
LKSTRTVKRRSAISISKKTNADFEKYRATLSAEKGKVQTQEDVMRALLGKANEQINE